MAVVTSTAFVTSVKHLISLPARQGRVDENGFYRFANRKMTDTIVPVIHSLNQEYFVIKTEEDIVANTTQYALPPRAFGRKLREVKLKNSSGNVSDFPQVAIERSQMYRAGSSPAAFYMYGDTLEIVPEPTQSGYSLQWWWFIAPGQIISVSDAALVTGVVGDDVTVSAVPTGWATGSIVDFIQGTGAGRYLDIDKSILSIAGTTITFDAGAVPTALAAGDYLSLSGTSPIIQLPEVAIPYLETLTAMEILGSISDYEGMERLKETREEQKKNMMLALAPRVDGELIPLVKDYGFLGGPRRGLWNIWGGV